jgi:hypothetical protein
MTGKDTDPTSNGVSVKLTAMIGVLMLALGGAALAGSGKMRGHGLFDRIDANDDELITSDEIVPFTEKRFARFDGNDDGTVSTAEVDAHIMKELERRRARILKRFDVDGDGSITQAEFAKQATQIFAGADTNNDGAVTRAEADEAREQLRSQFRRHMDEADGADTDAGQEN